MAEELTEELKYVVDVLEKLVNTPSPSGYTAEVLGFVESEARRMGRCV